MKSVKVVADGESAEQILRALRDILDQIDTAGLPADIGAHVDLACCRLEEMVDHTRTVNIQN